MGNRIEAIVPLWCSDCLSTTWAFTLTRCQCSSPLETTANLFIWASIHKLHQKSKGRATFSSNANTYEAHARPINTYSSLSYTHTHTQTFILQGEKKAIGPPWKEQFFIPSPCGQHDASKEQTIVTNYYISMTIGQKMSFVVFTYTFFFHLHCSFWLFVSWWEVELQICGDGVRWSQAAGQLSFFYHLKYCALSCCIVRLEASHHSLMYHTQWLPHFHDQRWGGYTQL